MSQEQMMEFKKMMMEWDSVFKENMHQFFHGNMKRVVSEAEDRGARMERARIKEEICKLLDDQHLSKEAYLKKPKRTSLNSW